MKTFVIIATPFILAALAGLGWLYRHERERRVAVEQQVSELKYTAYKALIDLFFDMMKRTRTNQPINEADAVDRMTDANKDLMLYGSDDVLHLYHAWLLEARAGTLDLGRFGELIVAMRRDMGSPKTTVTSEDVLRQLLTDYDEAVARGQLVIRRG